MPLLTSRTSRTEVRKQDDDDLLLEIEALSAFEQAAANELTAALLDTFERVSASADTFDFLQAIANNNLVQAKVVLSWGDFADAIDILEQILHAQLQSGGPLGLPEFGVGFRYQFEATNPLGIDWAKKEAARQIRELTLEQQATVNQTIVDAISKGYSVDDVQFIVSNTIGLHSRWAKAVDTKYEKTLENLLAQGYSPTKAREQARRIVKDYHDELVDKRARAIARTEVLSAHNAGRYMTWEDAIAAGIAPTNALKKWVVRVPERSGSPCEDCLPLNGLIVPYNEEFDGLVMMPPLHPNCVCTAVMVIPEDPEYSDI